MIHIALVGGGTGGHVYPLLAVAAALQEQARAAGIDLRLHYYGPNDRFRKDVEAQGIKFHWLMTGKLRRYASLLTLIDLPKAFLGTIQALFQMYGLMPDVILSKGGAGALQLSLAGWFYKIPIVIHESDAVPGLTTMLTARLAKKIGFSFEATAKYFDPRKAVMAGNPVRPHLLAGRLSQEEAKRKLGFDPAKPLLYVTGGSQGAAKLNQFIILNMGVILPVIQILHQTGPGNYAEAKKLAEAELVQLPPAVSTQSRYASLGYLAPEEQKDALAAADVVVGRAGASTIAEAAAFGKPAILVPLPGAARNHQRQNAMAYYEAGAAVVMEEENLTPGIFMSELQRLLTDRGAYQGMAQAAAAFAKPDAARTMAAAVLEVV